MATTEPQTSPDRSIGSLEREALISLTALYFIEEHALLPAREIGIARQSLHALFLHATHEETLLRKLINTLRATRRLHHSFSRIAGVVDGVHKCADATEEKTAALRAQLEMLKISAEEQAAFVGPFLEFAQMFLQRTREYARLVREYLALREHEARCAIDYETAKAAREQIRQRLSGQLGSEASTGMKQKIVARFNYGEAEHNLRHAARDARKKQDQALALLDEIKLMCEMAKNPAMREHAGLARAHNEDVYRRYADTLALHPRLLKIKEPVIELFRMYQHAFGIFRLDFDNLHREIDSMMVNADAYFESKEEDQDIAMKRQKLRMIEGLIPLLEQSVTALGDDELNKFERFSRRFSDLISQAGSIWQHITEGLLRAKVQAEAELTTRL